jgi:hypothetical protein
MASEAVFCCIRCGKPCAWLTFVSMLVERSLMNTGQCGEMYVALS